MEPVMHSDSRQLRDARFAIYLSLGVGVIMGQAFQPGFQRALADACEPHPPAKKPAAAQEGCPTT
jgi:hypothetical protein